MYGLVSTSDEGVEMPAKKSTRWLTNAPRIADRLRLRCDAQHDHQPLIEGRAAAAQVYTPQLCRAIVDGVADQLREDATQWEQQISSLILEDSVQGVDLDILECEEAPETSISASDDISGESLDPERVQRARQEEMQYLWDRKVYEYGSIRECKEALGRGPLGLKWIDTVKAAKGPGEDRRYRSRLVATEVRQRGTDPVFSATPPLEALRALLALAAQENPEQSANPLRISIADVSRAHFYAEAKRDTWVRLPPEDPRHGESDVCGKLLRTWYGTLDAAMLWGENYAELLKANGFRRGKASPCHFYNPATEVRILVYGDDFFYSRPRLRSRGGP